MKKALDGVYTEAGVRQELYDGCISLSPKAKSNHCIYIKHIIIL